MRPVCARIAATVGAGPLRLPSHARRRPAPTAAGVDTGRCTVIAVGHLVRPAAEQNQHRAGVEIEPDGLGQIGDRRQRHDAA